MLRRLELSMALLTEVSVELIVRMMVLLFWKTYNRCSWHLILLNETPLKVMAREPVVFLRVSTLLSKYRTVNVKHNFVHCISVGSL
jgi:hypothetical protein